MLVFEALVLNNHISSPEFTTLCQSQLSLLSHGLGAVWSVIYLADNISEDEQTQLFPFVIYPQEGNQSFWELPPIKLAEIWQASQSCFIAQLLPDYLTSQIETQKADNWQLEVSKTKQLIFPLIHQETFMGLLVTGREDREWQPDEHQQAEEIARTIAIARFIELQYSWTRNELLQQENLRQIEHDRLDNLVHQLRNPLTALRTFGRLLLKRILPSDSNGKLVEGILAQSDRFEALLEQFEAESEQLPEVNRVNNSLPLLETKQSNIDQSSFLLPSSTAELHPVDLNQIIEPILITAQAIASERNIELANHLPAIIPSVIGDLAALREIFNNLLDNALKYTASGGKVQLDLAMSRDKMLGIAVQDTGTGIPFADQERIFERHYRGVQAQGDIVGTGLGLAIAQELAIKMRGEIELISPNNLSKDSPGTTFIVWLPSINGLPAKIDN
ncbi:MAG: sensor histidine kinase [Pleurocapsa sp. SU_5_0]|nr:sensor histidine kinase [Pleurocapsa sp. SU_5_0]